MVTVEEIRNAQRAKGPATILSIGTATPSHCVYQADYPDYYFRITKSEHQTALIEKFKRMCDKSQIRKRYLHLTEEILKENPSMCAYMAPSLDARQDMVVVEVPKLGKEAATKAIKEWGQPKSKITHLIFCTTSGVDMPGADYQLTKLLGLRSSVKRFMMYQQGCFAGGTVLRMAKDLAENNAGARVLVVCSEITAVTFRGPSESHLDSLVGQALFGDGAGALIVGADPDTSIERPLFQLVSAAQTILPDSDGAIDGHLREVGLTFHLLKDVPGLISKNIQKSLVEAFSPIGISNWNELFWIAHPGGPAILDQVELKLGLKEEKLKPTRHVLSEYGNMSSACVLFILDEMRKQSLEDGKVTTGDGLSKGETARGKATGDGLSKGETARGKATGAEVRRQAFTKTLVFPWQSESRSISLIFGYDPFVVIGGISMVAGCTFVYKELAVTGRDCRGFPICDCNGVYRA